MTTELTRRSLLHAIAAVVATTASPLSVAEVAQALEQAHPVPQTREAATPSFLEPAEAADLAAVVAKIVPTDDSPGASEAGVVHFIDRALGTFFAQLAAGYREQLAAFQAAYRTQYPAAVSFGSLTSEQQIGFLQTVDRTPFFTTTRLLTLLGMFSSPVHGGNRNGLGWKLIGFEDSHVFRPPFGYYDRNYPGFAIDPVNAK